MIPIKSSIHGKAGTVKNLKSKILNFALSHRFPLSSSTIVELDSDLILNV